jgi:hypothetical protein
MRLFRITAIAALIFVGLSGLVGGVPLIIHAHEEPWWLPQSLLQYSPFHSYLIPGIILFTAIGLLSCWVLWLTLRVHKNFGWWVTLQGCVLLGWLVTEMIMLRLVVWPQILYSLFAGALVLSGVRLTRQNE